MQSINFLRTSSFKNLLLFVFLLAAFTLFAAIVVEILLEKENYIDTASFSFLEALDNPTLTRIMVFISVLGSGYVLIPAYVILIVWFVKKKQNRTAIYIATIAITSSLMLYFLKLYFHRDRPINALDGVSSTYSFPSGHTTSAFIFYGLLIFLIWQNDWKKKYKYLLSAVFCIIALLVAVSRIYLHRHFASDVLAGFCVGTIWLCIAIWSFKKIQ